MLARQQVAIFRQTAGTFCFCSGTNTGVDAARKKYGCSQFQFCSEFLQNGRFFLPGFAFWGKNFLTQINIYEGPKLTSENWFLSTDCTAFLLCMLIPGYLLEFFFTIGHYLAYFLS